MTKGPSERDLRAVAVRAAAADLYDDESEREAFARWVESAFGDTSTDRVLEDLGGDMRRDRTATQYRQWVRHVFADYATDDELRELERDPDADPEFRAFIAEIHEERDRERDGGVHEDDIAAGDCDRFARGLVLGNGQRFETDAELRQWLAQRAAEVKR